MKKIISVFCKVFALTVMFGVTAFAAPTDSFTRSDQPGQETQTVLAREMYTAVMQITSGSLGLDEPLEKINDIYCTPDGDIYLLGGADSKVIVLNEDYTLKTSFSITDSDGHEVTFTDAKGIYVDEKANIYICDTMGGRIIISDSQGAVTSIWEVSDSPLIPKDFVFQPIRMLKDDRGYFYVLSLGCYYGAMFYSPEGEFIGFYGANTVEASALDTLSFLWDKLLGTDAKRSASLKTLPYAFVDFCFDSDDYLLTCTGMTDEELNGIGQIRKINASGANILYKRSVYGGMSESSGLNFLEDKVVLRNEKPRVQNLVSLDVDANGYIFALDQTYGLIYVYDSESNLLNGFGGGIGTGTQLGVFSNPVSLAVHGSSILVSDTENRSITVFDITSFGELLKSAQAMYIKGDYDDAKPLWEQVLQYDQGNQRAYRGLAMAAYNEGNYSTAMSYAEKGLDYTVYDLASQEILKSFFARNFVWILLVGLVLIGGTVAIAVTLKKRRTVLITNVKVKTLFAVPFHPFRSFDDIKYKKQGSLLIAVILTALLYISFTLKATDSGFLFTDTAPQNYNMLYTLAQTVGLIVLWSVSNWLVCSLFSGKGILSEVFTATAYSLLPLIIFTFLRVIMSHFLPLSGLGLMNGLQTAVWIFTFFLLCVSMMTVHEYDFFRFLLTGIVIVFFMILIVFILFLMMTLLQQFYNFIYSFYMEIVYR